MLLKLSNAFEIHTCGNKMARVNEIECLEQIKSALKGEKKVNIWSNCDISEVSQFIFEARPNQNSNDFPDFVFDGGCIEHFEITSSRETRKGFQFKIDEQGYKKKKLEYHKELNKEALLIKHESGAIHTSTFEEIYDKFSYEDFLHSLEKNIKKHGNSLEKSPIRDKIVIYLIEQQSGRMYIQENEWRVKFCELNKDKRALEILKKYGEFIDYVIYFVSDSIEIIDVNKIDNLIDRAIEYKYVKVGRVVRSEITAIFDF